MVRTRLTVQSHVLPLKRRVIRVLATHGDRFTGTRSNCTERHRAWLGRLRRQLEPLDYLEAQQQPLEAEIDRH